MESVLQTYLTNHTERILKDEDSTMVWAGDFNRHHPMWDRNEDVHLFIGLAQQAAEKLVNMLVEYNMEMALPKDTPTL